LKAETHRSVVLSRRQGISLGRSARG